MAYLWERQKYHGEEFLLAGEMRESFTEQVASELERTSREGNLCEQRTRGRRTMRNTLGACLAPGHERAREEERKWPRDMAGARWPNA